MKTLPLKNRRRRGARVPHHVIAALQDKPALCPMDSKSSLSVYSQLLNDLQALIDHY